ncbi:MAG: hypothetical protein Ct9H90mP8_0380 [Pseudomonadota bacterium]|nr:MAG: hypothetical protein Ct9H90mP8_0380 [Pseudomonadota bacterium]
MKRKNPIPDDRHFRTSRDDNFLSVSQESTKTAAYKGSLTLFKPLNNALTINRDGFESQIMGEGTGKKTLRIILFFLNKFPGTFLKISIFFPFELKTSLG